MTLKQAQESLNVETTGQGAYDVTGRVCGWVNRQDIQSGMLNLFCRHTSASLTIQENADPRVLKDLAAFLKKLAPEDPSLYSHVEEGPDDMPAHIRSALTGVSLSIPVAGGRPVLGVWQGVYLLEHRARAHTRHLVMHLSGE